jgi:hypothetical protein
VTGERKEREEGAESCEDHQRAETILGPVPPGDQSAEDVREDHPNGEGGPQTRLGQVVAL